MSYKTGQASIGMKFGKLTAIEFTGHCKYYGKKKIESEIWVVQCECGKQMERSVMLLQSVVRSGGTPACSKCQKRHKTYPYKGLQIAGQTFGKLTALQPVFVNHRHQWEFQCECGAIVTRRANDVIRSVKNGYFPRCGSAGCRQHLNDEEAIWFSVTSSYRNSARERGLTFNLTVEEVKKLGTSNCHYCGTEPSLPVHHKRRPDVETTRNGIDRIDSDQGYIPGNVVPCCWMCNRAKLDASYEEFVSWLRRTASFQASQT